ncbi:MAG TPA: hypothetical protein VJ625_17705, partial [Propionibacteriaceae bacterium]|nr:hypothetical protein [Propionibacteriaceae bacterium]
MAGLQPQLLDPQRHHHAVPDRHDAAYVPAVLGHKPVVLSDERGRRVPWAGAVATRPLQIVLSHSHR